MHMRHIKDWAGFRHGNLDAPVLEISSEPSVSKKPRKRTKCKTAQAPERFSLAFLEQSGKRHAQAAQGNFLINAIKSLKKLVRFIGGYSSFERIFRARPGFCSQGFTSPFPPLHP